MTNQTKTHVLAAPQRCCPDGAPQFAHALVRARFPGRMLRAVLRAEDRVDDRAGDRGSALVEFALILPMLLLLTTGLLIFGVAMNNYLQLTNAVSIGARTLAVSAQITLDPCATASTAIINAAPGLTSSNLKFSYLLNGVAYSGTSCSSASVSSGAAENLSSGTTATVTATYPLNLSVFGQKYSATNAVLQATSTELVQ